MAFSVPYNSTINFNSSLYLSSPMNINFFCQSGYYDSNVGCDVALLTNDAKFSNKVCIT